MTKKIAYIKCTYSALYDKYGSFLYSVQRSSLFFVNMEEAPIMINVEEASEGFNGGLLSEEAFVSIQNSIIKSLKGKNTKLGAREEYYNFIRIDKYGRVFPLAFHDIYVYASNKSIDIETVEEPEPEPKEKSKLPLFAGLALLVLSKI